MHAMAFWTPAPMGERAPWICINVLNLSCSLPIKDAKMMKEHTQCIPNAYPAFQTCNFWSLFHTRPSHNMYLSAGNQWLTPEGAPDFIIPVSKIGGFAMYALTGWNDVKWMNVVICRQIWMINIGGTPVHTIPLFSPTFAPGRWADVMGAQKARHPHLF